MKLCLCQILFQLACRLVALTRWAHAKADDMHVWAWLQCTRANLATCKRRAARKDILS